MDCNFFGILNNFGPFQYHELDVPINCDDGRNTTSGSINFILTENQYNGYIANLVDYLMCKLNLTLIMRKAKTCKEFENETQVCTLSDNLDAKQMLSSKFVPILLEYDIQILSVLKYDNDLSYFSYTKLFSIWTWLLLLLSLLIYATLFRYLNNSNIPFVEYLSILLKNFLIQSSRLLRKLHHLAGKLLFFLLFIGIVCTTILSKSFTSLLLRTYYIKIPSLTVETLEEIAYNQELNVLGSSAIKLLVESKPQIYSILKEKALKYESEFTGIDFSDYKSLPNDKLIKDVINRKTTIITRGFAIEMLTRLYPDSSLSISDTKFSQVFKYTFVTRNHTKSQLIYKYIEHNYEAGFTEKFFMVLLNVAEICGKVGEHKTELAVNDQGSKRQPIILNIFARGPIPTLYAGYLLGFFVLVLECLQFYMVKYRFK